MVLCDTNTSGNVFCFHGATVALPIYLSVGEVMVYAKTAEELTSGVAIIKSCIVEHILNVPDENKPCLRQPSWSMMKDGMLKDNDGELRINVAEDTR